MPTAIEFFKFLPKTNCGECGHPTCLAFAMQLANQKVSIDACPYVDSGAKEKLEESSAPPVKGFSVGLGDNSLRMGDETVLYRHERKFVNPTAFAVTVTDAMSSDEMAETVSRHSSMTFERVGMEFRLDMFALRDETGDAESYTDAAKNLVGLTDWPIVLISGRPDVLRPAAELLKDRRPLLYSADDSNIKEMAAIASGLGLPLALRDDTFDGMAALVEEARKAGVEDLILDLGSGSMKQVLENNTVARKVSLRRTFKGLGYPLMNCVGGGEGAVKKAMVAVMKYGSLVVFDSIEPQQALPLMTLRQNIYTDPQVPIQVKEDLYPISDPDAASPVLFTTNFSLTYFTVRADIEKSRQPVWLQVVDTEGLSVLTAYAAGKFGPEHVTAALEASGALDRSEGPIVTPGMVAKLSGKLEEALGRKVMVGPMESSSLPKFLKGLKE